VYLLILLRALGCLRILRLLVILELLSWLFVVIIPRSFSLNYLIVQSYFLLIRLIGALYTPILLVLGLIIKLGLPPFHIWFLRIARVMNKNRFIFIISFHKLLPIFFLRKIVFSLVTISIVVIIIILIGRALVYRRTLFFTLVFSSIVHRVWIVYRALTRKGFILIYWGFYRILLLLIIRFLGLIKLDQIALNQRALIASCWLLMSGVPPFIIFWIKVYILLWLILSSGFFLRLVIVLVRVFALTSYYRAWHFGRLLEVRWLLGKPLSPFIMVMRFWILFFQ